MEKSILNRVAFDSRTYILLLALLLIIVASSLLGTSKPEIQTLQKIELKLHEIPQDDVKVQYIK